MLPSIEFTTFASSSFFLCFMTFSAFSAVKQCAVKNVEYHALCFGVTFTVVSCVVVYKECVIR